MLPGLTASPRILSNVESWSCRAQSGSMKCMLFARIGRRVVGSMGPSFDSAISIAFNGIQRNLSGLQQNAHRVASSATGAKDVVDYPEPLVDMQRQRSAIQAAAKFISRTDETLGTIIDRLA